MRAIHASLQATKVYNEQMLELHRGQGMEIYWRDNFTCPTESDYKLMTIRKTGGLFMLAIRLMQLFSSNTDDFSKLTAILGLYFQIRDDYCNLICKEVCIHIDHSTNTYQHSFNIHSLFRSIPRAKAFVKISPRANSAFPSYMR